jgi:hypothetical protein
MAAARRCRIEWVRGRDINIPEAVMLEVDELADAAKVAEHLSYLQRMSSNGVVSADHAARAVQTWKAARAATSATLPVPAAAAFQGGPIEYHWEVGPHQMSAEIPADGPCHWFYRNKDTGETWGAENPADDGLSPRLTHYLTRIAASSR